MPITTRFSQLLDDIKSGKSAGRLSLAGYKPMTNDKWDKLEQVLPNSKIMHLDASRCELDEVSQTRFIQLVEKSEQLMIVNLSENAIIDEKIIDLMDKIQKHPHVVDLRVNNTLTTMGFNLFANQIVKNTTLKSLSIIHQRVDDINGMKIVMKGLEENTSLKTLNLSHSVMRSSFDEAWSSVGNMLIKNNTLEELNINNTNLRNQDMQALVAGMKRPNSALVHLRLKMCVLLPLNACFDTLLETIPQSQLIKIEGLDDGSSVYPGINTELFVTALKANQAKMQQQLLAQQANVSSVGQNKHKKRGHDEITSAPNAVNNMNSNTRMVDSNATIMMFPKKPKVVRRSVSEVVGATKKMVL